MVQKEKLIQFYFAQYNECAKRFKKKSNTRPGDYEKRIQTLGKMLKHTHLSPNNLVRLEEYHRQIRNLSYFAFRQNNPVAIMQIRQVLIPELVRMDVETLTKEEAELVTAKTIEGLRREMPYEICKRTLKTLSRNYFELDIKKQIIHMVPANPEQEFPEAIEMERRFILHVGPTNCGKTYHALERLKEAEDGSGDMILRLLETGGKASSVELSIPVMNYKIALDFTPYEIKTIRILQGNITQETNLLEEEYGLL